MSEIDKEFEAAAKALSNAELALEVAGMQNTPHDPVERQKARVEFERIRSELLVARSRMERARRAKYPNCGA